MKGPVPVRVVGPHLWRQAIEQLLTSLPNVHVVPSHVPWELGHVTLLMGLGSSNVREYLQQQGSMRCILVTNDLEMRTPLFPQSNITVFVGEQDETDVLRDAIQRAAQDEAFCSPSLIASLISAAQSSSSPPNAVGKTLSPPFAQLSMREREVVSHALEGWSNDQIASHLHVSISTIKFHLLHAYRKLGISRRAELRLALAEQQEVAGN